MLTAESQGIRLESVFNEKKIDKNKRHKILGYKAPTSYNGVISGRKGISFSLLLKLHDFDSNLNLHWLITGDGSMYLNDKKTKDGPSNIVKEEEVGYEVAGSRLSELNNRVKQLESQFKEMSLSMNNILLLEREKQLLKDIEELKQSKQKLIKGRLNLQD